MKSLDWEFVFDSMIIKRGVGIPFSGYRSEKYVNFHQSLMLIQN